MSEQIPINENMPEDLKIAINYLNENNISLTDKLDVDDDNEVEELDDEEFDGNVSDEDIVPILDDDIEEDSNVDMSDLDSIF